MENLDREFFRLITFPESSIKSLNDNCKLLSHFWPLNSVGSGYNLQSYQWILLFLNFSSLNGPAAMGLAAFADQIKCNAVKQFLQKTHPCEPSKTWENAWNRFLSDIFWTAFCVMYFKGHVPGKKKCTDRELREYSATYVTFGPNGTDLLVNLGSEQIYLYDILSKSRSLLPSISALCQNHNTSDIERTNNNQGKLFFSDLCFWLIRPNFSNFLHICNTTVVLHYCNSSTCTIPVNLCENNRSQLSHSRVHVSIEDLLWKRFLRKKPCCIWYP